MLVNDGTNDYGFIYAPVRIPADDYAIEAEMRAVMQVHGGNWAGVGVFGRVSEGGTGFFAGYYSARQTAEIRVGGNNGGDLGEAQFAVGGNWRTFRLEVKGTAVRLFVDGVLLLEREDNRFLRGGRVGLWSSGIQSTVRKFRVIAL